MGIRRVVWKVRRISRKWKPILYLVGFIAVMKALVAYHSGPDITEFTKLEQIRQAQIDNHNKAAEAILKGEKSVIAGQEHIFVNPKDPKLRENFLNGAEINVILEERMKQESKRIRLLDKEAIELELNFGEENLPAVVFQPKYDNLIFLNQFLAWKQTINKSVARCEITLKDSLSAISRAKQNYCKQMIADVACQMQSNTLFSKGMPRTCPHPEKYTSDAAIPKSFDESQPRVKICYMLVVHGRSVRQIKRMIKNIYDTRHYYYIHVDKRSDYLHREMIKLTEQYSNIKVAPWRLSTIWGGSSLLQMLLKAIKDTLNLWSDWDFFINLSALDFPIETQDNLEKFLTTHREKNFMKSHGRDDEKFIRKQGLNRVFVECEQHMWRLGERNIPEGITLNGGSDWVALNRKLCKIAVYGDSELLRLLKHWYKYTLLPAESFFHTLVQNSELCETFVDNNLRVTNWNRARGCKCQYKHIVDWCGCSPNDFFPSDLSRLQTTRPVFFARKFEEIVNQEVVNHLDFKLYGKYPEGTPGIRSYWENVYDSYDGPTSIADEFLTHYMSFARLSLTFLNPPTEDDMAQPIESDICRLHPSMLNMVEIHKHKEVFQGYLVTMDVEWRKSGEKVSSPLPNSHLQIQSLVTKSSNIRIIDYSSPLASRLDWALIGTKWDVKELLLRDWGGIIGPQSDPRLVMKWTESKDDFIVTVVLIDPLNVIAEYTDFRTPLKASGVTETILNINKPIRPGKWTIRFYIQRNFQKVAAEMNFIVTPLQFRKGVIDDVSLVTDNRGVINDDDLNSVKRNLYSIRTTLNLQKDLGAERSLEERASYIGEDLEAWIDEIIGTRWSVEDTCIVSSTSESWHLSQPTEHCSPYKRVAPKLCKNTDWSSFSPDPKSHLGKVNSNGRIR